MDRKIVYENASSEEMNVAVKRALSDPGSVTSISVDREAIAKLNQDVITMDNAWALVVGCSLAYAGSSGDRLYRCDVESMIPKEYAGHEVIISLLDLIVKTGAPIGIMFESEAPYPTTNKNKGVSVIGQKLNKEDGSQ